MAVISGFTTILVVIFAIKNSFQIIEITVATFMLHFGKNILKWMQLQSKDCDTYAKVHIPFQNLRFVKSVYNFIKISAYLSEHVPAKVKLVGFGKMERW